MYSSYWQLSGMPFENAGDGRWFAETAVHGEALARLEFLLEHRRRVGLLRGAKGTGKSATLQQLLRLRTRLERETVFVDLTGIESHELLWRLAAGLCLGPNNTETPLQLWRRLEHALNGLRFAGRQTVFLFDHFDPMQQGVHRVVERLQHLESALSGWTTTIIAIRNGQPLERIRSLLELSDLRIELNPLDPMQTSLYIQELLEQAGSQQQIFEEQALAQITRHSAGIPREINRICDFALLAAMQGQRRTIDAEIVATVAEELQYKTVTGDDDLESQELATATVR